MEINAENLAQLAGYLQQTLSPDPNVRRPGKILFCLMLRNFINFSISAEKLLESIEVQRNYALLLLNLIDKQDADMTIRVAGAIAFKNYIKRNWAAHEVCFCCIILIVVLIIKQIHFRIMMVLIKFIPMIVWPLRL